MCIFPNSKMLLFFDQASKVFTFKLRLITENIMPIIKKLKEKKIKIVL